MTGDDVRTRGEARSVDGGSSAEPEPEAQGRPPPLRFYADAVWRLNPGLPHVLDLPLKPSPTT